MTQGRWPTIMVFAFAVACLAVASVLASAAEAGLPAAPKAGAKSVLPDSEGRTLVERACTGCHDLGGLDAYKGYWGRVQWKAMIDGMVKNGAVLLPAEQDVVADYLVRHFGPGIRQ